MNRHLEHLQPHARHDAQRFVRWQLLAVYGSGLLLLGSGVAWLAVNYSLGAGAGELPHPAQAWLLRLHGLAAELALFALGLVAAVHIPRGWRASARHRWSRQRRSGVLLCALAVLAAFSGYLLYYFAPEWLRPGLGWTHAAAGTLMALGLFAHRRGVTRARVHEAALRSSN